MKLDPLGGVKGIGQVDCNARSDIGILNPGLQEPPIDSIHSLDA